jgi:UDP-glucose 4-epimerase
MQSWIFRFVSILGPNYTHGHVIDFFHQLRKHPKFLTVLGNGHQRKSYLHVEDCLNAISIATKKSDSKINVFNLGLNDTCSVMDSVSWICDRLELDPSINYGTEAKGWIGDNPLIHLSTEKIMHLGWTPRYSIKQSIVDTVEYLIENE